MTNITKLYDARCPLCGKINRSLLLDETSGWMECDRCKRALHLCRTEELTAIPGYDPNKEAWLVRHAG